MIARKLTLAISLLALLLVAVPAVAQALTVKTDKPTYLPGETVVVSGNAPADQYVSIDIVNPDGKIVDTKIVKAGSDGTYTASFKLPSTLPYGDWKEGKYTVKAYVGTLVATTSFELIAGGVIKGRVVDEYGAPVPEALVAVVELGKTVTTGTDGKFSIATGAGTFTITVSKQNYFGISKKATVAVGEITDLGDLKILSYGYVILQLNETLTKLRADLVALQQDITNKLTAISNSLGDVSKKIDALTTTVNTINTNLNTLNSKVDTLTTTVNTIKTNLDSALNSLNAISTDLSTVKSDIAGIKASIATLSDTVNKLTPTIEQLRTDITGLKTDVASVKNDVTSVKNAVSGLDASIKDVKSAVDTSKAEVGGKVDSLAVAIYIAVIFALLSFIMSLLVFLSMRKAVAAK